MTGGLRMIVAACMVVSSTACNDGSVLLEAALNGGLPLVEAFQVPPDLGGEGPEESIRIWYSFTNRTDGTLFLVTGCHSLSVDRLEDDEWVPVWPPPRTFCLLGDPEVHWLAPGEPFADLIELPATDDWISGDHRVRLNTIFAEGKIRGEARDNPLPLALRVSQPFLLEIPAPEPAEGGEG